MTYEAWRITYQSSEAAARAAYNTVEKLHEENQALRKHVDGLQAALGAQVRFGSEGFLAAIEKLPRYTYNYASEDGKFLLRDEVLAAIASQARQATPTADMGNTTSQPPAATEAGNPASGAQDKMSTTQQPAALRLARKLEEAGFVGDHRLAQTRWCSEAASELRRLHAENQDLRTRHYCNTAEIESLQNRVQELGEMARENRSKRIVELEGRIAEMESEAEQNAKIIGASAETELALRARLEEMERELAAIGAGGVEPLRKRADTADLAARQRELQLLDEIEALERLALRVLKQLGEEAAPQPPAVKESLTPETVNQQLTDPGSFNRVEVGGAVLQKVLTALSRDALDGKEDRAELQLEIMPSVGPAPQGLDTRVQDRLDRLYLALEVCSAELFAQCADQGRAMKYVEQARSALAAEQCARAAQAKQGGQ